MSKTYFSYFIIGILLLLNSLYPTRIIAQEKKVRVGAHISGSYSSLSYIWKGLSETSSAFGYRVGITTDIPLKKKFSLRPEINISNHKGTFNSELFSKEISDPERHETEIRTKYYSLQIPIDLVYNIPISDITLSILTGPVIDIPLWGKINNGYTKEWLDLEINNEKPYAFKPINVGFDLGFIAECKNFYFKINAICGFSGILKNQPESESKIYQNDVYFSLGYFFF